MHFALPRGSCGVGCGSVRPCYGKHARRGCYCYEVTLATISWTLGILSILSAMLTALVMAVILIYAAGPRAKIRPHTDAQLTAWRGPVPATAVVSPLPGLNSPALPPWQRATPTSALRISPRSTSRLTTLLTAAPVLLRPFTATGASRLPFTMRCRASRPRIPRGV